MPKILSESAVESYRKNGYYFPVPALTPAEAAHYRGRLEASERENGGPLQSNKRHKVHLLYTWANELVHHPKILDAIEDVLGPDLLCWTTNLFIKEARSTSFVSWHQDATYWGLSDDAVATAWIALGDVPHESGPMHFWPGSHLREQMPHRDTFHQDNLLSRGQELAVEVPAGEGVEVPLKAGEISLHHVKLVHGSGPNHSGGRRLGLAIRYIAPHVRQLKTRDSAMLVRGVDRYGHFDMEQEPKGDLDEAALAAHDDAMRRQVAALYQGTDKGAFRA